MAFVYRFVSKPYLLCSKGILFFSFEYVNIQPVANTPNNKLRKPIKAPRVTVALSNGWLCSIAAVSSMIAVLKRVEGVCFEGIECIVMPLREQLGLMLVTVAVESTVVVIVVVFHLVLVRLVVVRHFVVIDVVVTMLVYIALAQ